MCSIQFSCLEGAPSSSRADVPSDRQVPFALLSSWAAQYPTLECNPSVRSSNCRLELYLSLTHLVRAIYLATRSAPSHSWGGGNPEAVIYGHNRARSRVGFPCQIARLSRGHQRGAVYYLSLDRQGPEFCRLSCATILHSYVPAFLVTIVFEDSQF